MFAAAAFIAYLLDGMRLHRGDLGTETIVKYPGEEAVARQMCAPSRLMYWWVESPRKSSATMHARCAGQVTLVKDVDL